MNPAGSVSATSPKEPCPSAVIVTVTWPPASTGSGEKDLLALGSPASGRSGASVTVAGVRRRGSGSDHYAGIAEDLYPAECVEVCIDTAEDTRERVITRHAGGRYSVRKGGGAGCPEQGQRDRLAYARNLIRADCWMNK